MSTRALVVGGKSTRALAVGGDATSAPTRLAVQRRSVQFGAATHKHKRGSISRATTRVQEIEEHLQQLQQRIDGEQQKRGSRVYQLRRLQRRAASSSFAKVWTFLNAVVSISSCVFFVMDSTSPSAVSPESFLIEYALCFFFTVDLLLKLAVDQSPISYLLSYLGVCDVVTSVLLLVVVDSHWLGLSWESLTFLRTLRCLRLFRPVMLIQYINSEIYQEIVVIAGIFVGLLWISSAFMRWAEALSWFDAFFLNFTTISTIGYGTLRPETLVGKFIVCVQVILTFVLIPMQIQKIITILNLVSYYERRSYQPHEAGRHIVVAGEITANSMREFLRELFHEDHGVTNQYVVVIDVGLPSRELTNLLGESQHRNCTMYLSGSVMRQRDCRRGAVHACRAIFVLSAKASAKAHEQDAMTILRAMAVKRFFKRHSHTVGFGSRKAVLSMFVQLIDEQSKKLLWSADSDDVDRASSQEARKRTHAVCVSRMKLELIGKSCVCPGLPAMMCNLISSGGEQTLSAPWQNEYAHGCEYEIYRVPLTDSFSGHLFTDVAKMVRAEAGITMFALEVTPPSMSSRVLLNPGRWRIPNCAETQVHAFVIATDRDEADVLALVGAPTAPSTLFAGRRPSRSESMTWTGSIDAALARKHSNKISHIINRSGGGEASRVADAISTKLSAAAEEEKDRGDDTTTPQVPQYRDASIVRLLKERRTYAAANIVDARRDLAGISGHIVVSGSFGDMASFIAPLRVVHYQQQVIVIVSSALPTPVEWETISMYPEVYFLRGYPSHATDMQRAAIGTAARVVLLAHEKEGRGKDSLDRLTDDAHTIFAYRSLTSAYPSIPIVVELISATNLKLLSSSELQRHHNLYPDFAAGYVFEGSFLDTLLCQAYYNADIITVLEQLISGTDPGFVSRWNIRAAQTNAIQPVEEGVIYEVEIPMEFKTFKEYADHLFDEGVVVLALRRGRPIDGVAPMENTMPYIFTAPPCDAPIFEFDSALVLSQPIGNGTGRRGSIRPMNQRLSFIDSPKRASFVKKTFEADDAEDASAQGQSNKRGADVETDEEDDEVDILGRSESRRDSIQLPRAEIGGLGPGALLASHGSMLSADHCPTSPEAVFEDSESEDDVESRKQGEWKRSMLGEWEHLGREIAAMTPGAL